MLFGLPIEYFSTVTHPFVAGPLSAIPAFGVICLVIGAGIGLFMRERRLLLFLAPFLLSHLLMIVSWPFWGALSQEAAAWPLYIFNGLQIVLIAVIFFVTREAWQAAVPLAIFSVTYAWFASFLAGMVLTNVWL